MGKKPAVREIKSTPLRYAAPVLTCISAMPVALLAHWRWGHDPVMTAVLAGCGIGITWLTHRSWHKRHEATRALATGYAAAVTGWTVLATASDPVGHSQLNAWLVGSVVLPVAWWVRAHGLAAPHEADKRTRPDNGMGALPRLVSALKGSKLVRTDETEGRVSARIKLDKPLSSEDVQADKSSIASVLEVSADQVSVQHVPGRADMVDVAVTAPSRLGSKVRGPEPRHLGMSVADAPFPMGMRSDNKEIELWCCGDEGDEDTEPRILGHILCTGVTGAGKTETIRTLVMLARERRDVVPVIGDPEKFAQSFGDIADALGLAASDEVQTRRLVKNLPDAIRYRAQLLGSLQRKDGRRGYKQWVPECWTEHGIPLVIVDIEEAASVLEGDDENFDKAVRTARSVGIELIASMQTAIGSNIERKTRGQFAQTLTHGCKDMRDARFALSPGTLDAGADPTKWGGDFPGSVYAEMLGTPPSEWHVDARVYRYTEQEMRARLDASKAAGIWAQLDAGTAMALGKGIHVPDEKLTNYLDNAVGILSGQDAEMDEDAEPDFSRVATEDGEIDVTRPLAPSAHTEPFTFRQKKDRMDLEPAREMFEQRVRDLAAQDRPILPADVADLVDVAGRARSWAYAELERLEKAGYLERDTDSGPLAYRAKQRPVNGFALSR